jgi:GNAT superfamily N-acetyltransferase
MVADIVPAALRSMASARRRPSFSVRAVAGCSPADARLETQTRRGGRSNMNLTYRWATPDDAPLLGLWNGRLAEDERNRTRRPLDWMVERMRDWLATGEYTAVLFERDGAPLAYALLRQDPDELYLRHFYVDRPFRRQGTGRACIRLLLDEILPRDQRVTLDVLETNPNGHAFWRAMGFTEYCRHMEVMPEGRG